jgi:hypothetical protein
MRLSIVIQKKVTETVRSFCIWSLGTDILKDSLERTNILTDMLSHGIRFLKNIEGPAIDEYRISRRSIRVEIRCLPICFPYVCISVYKEF